MEVIDFILTAQQVKPEALVNLELESERGRLLVKWCWVDEAGNTKIFSRSLLLKELNYDEAIATFFIHSKSAIES